MGGALWARVISVTALSPLASHCHAVGRIDAGPTGMIGDTSGHRKPSSGGTSGTDSSLETYTDVVASSSHGNGSGHLPTQGQRAARWFTCTERGWRPRACCDHHWGLALPATEDGMLPCVILVWLGYMSITPACRLSVRTECDARCRVADRFSLGWPQGSAKKYILISILHSGTCLLKLSVLLSELVMRKPCRNPDFLESSFADSTRGDSRCWNRWNHTLILYKQHLRQVCFCAINIIVLSRVTNNLYSPISRLRTKVFPRCTSLAIKIMFSLKTLKHC